MKIIRNHSKIESSFIGEQKIDFSKTYRLSTYIISVKCDEGILLYNNLTDELLLLEKNEGEIINSIDVNNELTELLVKKWFFVSQEFDDVKLCENLSNFMKQITTTYNSRGPITEYTILTTTDCNARCFYCFEHGIKKITMNEKTAYDVAKYIKDSCRGEDVTFRWFGGEPLYNSNAIDIICSYLRENKIKYTSNMITNGYLFDDEIIKVAKKLWKLNEVQITLDGTEEIYNRCKAFIYKEGSAFKRVIKNIKKLLENNINVKIRMNADSHNFDDLFILVDYLIEKFGKHPNLSIYSHLLFDNTDKSTTRSYEEKKCLTQEHNKLLDYIMNTGLLAVQNLDGYLRYYQCMADNYRATIITPNGDLARCEHFTDSEIYGSIYSADVNTDVINKFRKKLPFTDNCKDCPVRPSCNILEVCPANPKVCNAEYKKIYINATKTRIKQTYKNYKQMCESEKNKCF